MNHTSSWSGGEAALMRLIDGDDEVVQPSTVLAVELIRRGSTRPRAT